MELFGCDGALDGGGAGPWYSLVLSACDGALGGAVSMMPMVVRVVDGGAG